MPNGKRWKQKNNSDILHSTDGLGAFLCNDGVVHGCARIHLDEMRCWKRYRNRHTHKSVYKMCCKRSVYKGYEKQRLQKGNPRLLKQLIIGKHGYAGWRVYTNKREKQENAAFQGGGGEIFCKIFWKTFKKPLDFFCCIIYNVSVVCLGMKW